MAVGDAEQLEIQQEDKLSDKCQTIFGHIQAFVILLQSSNIQSNSLPIKKQTYEKDFLHHHRSHRHHLIFNMYGTFAYQSNQSKPYIDFKKR